MLRLTLLALTLLAFLSPFITARPNPDLGSAIDSITSVAGAAATSIVGDVESVFSDVTSIGGLAYTVVTAAGGEAITLAADGVGEVTSFAGQVYTIITSDIGAVISAETAAVASATSKNSAHINSPAAFFHATPILTALLTTLGGIFIGARLAL